MSEVAQAAPVAAPVFPPSLVPVLRGRLDSARVLLDVDDHVLEELLTTVFFAGLEWYEGEHRAIRIVLLGRHGTEVVIPKPEPGAAPTYRWKILGFESPRPFEAPELVKLAVASADEHIFSAVRVRDDGRMVIDGLAREGFIADEDPFVRVVVSRPGCLSIRNGRSRLLEYERGLIVTGAEDVVLADGPVRTALQAAARGAGVDVDGLSDYFDAVRQLTAALAAHGHGGILVISPDDAPQVAASAAYRMMLDSSIVSMLRLARRLPRAAGPSYGRLLRNAFISEATRMIEECGALTAIDGATILSHALALVAFGVMLPIGSRPAVVVGVNHESEATTVDLESRGARHRASATYAAEHPGAVVFVASEDGLVSCMMREPAGTRVLAWQQHAGGAVAESRLTDARR